MGKYNNLYREKAAKNIEVPYYYSVFLLCLQVSLKRLWGSPIIFTILPIIIKDFPYNVSVNFPTIAFPYYFYKYGMYFSPKSLQKFAVCSLHFDLVSWLLALEATELVS